MKQLKRILFLTALLIISTRYVHSAEKKVSPTANKIKVTFVELGSVKCVPCKMMQPVMKELEKEKKMLQEVGFDE